MLGLPIQLTPCLNGSVLHAGSQNMLEANPDRFAFSPVPSSYHDALYVLCFQPPLNVTEKLLIIFSF